MTEIDIDARLHALGDKLKRAEHRIDMKALKNAEHLVIISQLRERYSLLLNQVEKDVTSAEALGHHVSDLEKSVMVWYEGLDN